MNVLILIADEHRAGDLGCAGNVVVQTPHLDGLAAQGCRLAGHTCSSPVCTASRASLLTGQYPLTHGAYHVGDTLERRWPTLADRLGQAGWATGIHGKVHLEPEQSGFVRRLAADQPYYGFAEHAITEDTLEGPYLAWIRQHHPDWEAAAWDQVNEELARPPTYGVRDGRLLAARPSPLPPELSQTAWTAARTADFIRRHAGRRPFLAVCSFVDPHHPFTPPAAYAQRYDPAAMPLPARLESDPPEWLRSGPPGRAAYNQAPGLSDQGLRELVALTYAMITQIDDACGRLLQLLDELGVAEDTLVIYTSDHGDYLGERRLVRKGVDLCDALLRTPLLLRLPGAARGAAGAVLTAPSQHEDLAPTILAAAGLATADLPGHDLAPWIRGGPPPRAYAHFLHNHTPQRQSWGVSDGRLKYTTHPAAGRQALIDLHSDPLERQNLVDDPGHATDVARLQGALLTWLTTTPHWRPAKTWPW